MAEILTELPEGFLDELSIDSRQKEILLSQIMRFNSLKGKTINNKGIYTNDLGEMIFPEGTIIHGTSNCDIEKITNIAESGILTGQAIGKEEDGETFYCADFHRIPKEVTIKEYNSSFNYRDGRTPFGHNSGRFSIAFVIHPCEELQTLMSYDCYRNGTQESELTKTFINGLPISDKNLASSILYGVPSNAFSGIILGDAVCATNNILEFIIRLFPDCYVASKYGDIIHDPALKSIDSKELSEIRRQKYLLKIENENLKRQMDQKEIVLAGEMKKYSDLMNAILSVCPTEQVAMILLENGWQGTLESTIGYVERLKATELNNRRF